MCIVLPVEAPLSLICVIIIIVIVISDQLFKPQQTDGFLESLFFDHRVMSVVCLP